LRHAQPLSILSRSLPTLGTDACINTRRGMFPVTPKKGTLFVRCSEEEAERIRHAAKAERCTLSGYILHAVLSRIEAKEKLLRESDKSTFSSKVHYTERPALGLMWIGISKQGF